MIVLKKHAQVEFIKGYNRTCVYDISRRDYEFIPNNIANLFLNKVHIIESDLDYTDPDIKYWIDLLFEKEYIFRIPKKLSKRFINIDRHFISPNNIEFAIIEIDSEVDFEIFSKLESLFCRHIALKFNEIKEIDNLLNIIISNYFFESVSIILDKEIAIEEQNYLKNKYLNLYKIEKHKIDTSNKYFRPDFRINIEIFNEALKYNVYHNRRIYINKAGYFSFGINDKNFSKEKFLNTSDFDSELWRVSKDKCLVCKECEFRYMCIDNRIPKKNQNNMYYYVDECSYNPYISKWNNDKDYYTLSQIGIKYPDFTVDENEIKEIIEEIW
ncbi:MAG: hypothetical protein RSF68_01400 [Myroides sp.]